MNQHTVIPIFSDEDVQRVALQRMKRDRDRYREILAECATRKLDHLDADSKDLVTNCWALIRDGVDIKALLEEMETFEKGFQLTRLLLVNANNKAKE